MIDNLPSAMLAWLLTYAIHSSVLLGLAWVLVRLRRWTPAAADLLWKSAMLGGILTATVQLRFDVQPAGTFSLARHTLAASAALPTRDQASSPVLASSVKPELARSAHAKAEPELLDEQTKAAGAAVTQAASPAPSKLSRDVAVVLLWSIVALALALTYAARRLILVGRIGDRRAVPDGRVLQLLQQLTREAGIRRAPRLTATERISSPIALGVREICVPETALTELDLEQQRSMLAHELAHLARRDPLWLALASLIERVFWIQPMNRVARRQIATAAEYICDDWAVRRTGSGVALARCLAQVAEWIQASPLGVPVAGMAEERSLLVSRVARLLEGKAPSTRSRRVLAFGLVSVLMLTIALAPSVTGKTARASAVKDETPEQQVAAARDTIDPPALTDLLVARGMLAKTLRSVGRPVLARGRHSTQLSSADSAVVIALIARLKDEDAEVRAAAARSLGRLEDARAVPGLIGALKDTNARVRAAAAESLGEFKDARAIEALSLALRDSSTEVKQHALDALSNYEEGVSSTGIARLLGDANPDIRQKAAQLLGQLKDRTSSAALTKLVSDSNADVRQAAIQSLAELHDPSAAAAILPALADPNKDVREQAVQAIEELRAPIPEATLLTLMRDPSPDVRAKAAELAGERSVIGAIPTLRRMLDDQNSDVRQNAVQALSNIADNSAYEALRAALNSKDPKVRRAAVEALGERRQ